MSRLPETAPSLLRHLRQQERATRRQGDASPYSRSGISITAEGTAVFGGVAQSWDFDGSSPDDLGTAGWYLGPAPDGSSRLGLNGVDVYADLAAKQSALESALSELADQQAYLASLISRDAQIGTFSTGTLTNDSAFHLIGSQIVIPDVAVPTGKVRVTLSCSEASVAPGANAVVAAICFAIDGQWSLDPTTKYARVYTAGNQMGVSLSRIGTETLTPGTYTFRAQAGYWSNGASSASINFAGLRLLVEVIGAD